MTISRRSFVAAAASAVFGAPAVAQARSPDPIIFASILDITGALGIYGASMAYATRMAIDDINISGGLLGRRVELVQFDAESSLDLYGKHASQAATQFRASVVQGGITSTSREAIRPLLGRLETLYFYNTQYEGGVCDSNCVCTGSTPAQTVARVVPYAMNKWGGTVYVVAADYNYGQIIAQWIRKFVADAGGETIGVELFPLDGTNFAPAIASIMRASPSLVISALIGGAHLSFYRQYAAAGLHRKIPVASTTFGIGNEQELIPAEECDGIIAAYSYFESIDNTANTAMLARLAAEFGPSRPALNELAVRSYEGAMLWAAAVREAGTVDRGPVTKALRRGLGYDGPSGNITIDPATNNTIMNVYIAELRKQKWSIVEQYTAQPPADTRLVCDLVSKPKLTGNFFENGLGPAGFK